MVSVGRPHDHPGLIGPVLYFNSGNEGSISDFTGSIPDYGDTQPSWHGISSSSAAHTHVEMRLGRKELAAKSVDDSTPDNPNPTSFWNARGYDVR